MSDEYEPKVWRCLIREVRAGDTFADIGAFHGLYACAVGKRVGKEGRVYAFKPDPNNVSFLKEHVGLNHLENIATVENKAVSSKSGLVSFNSGRGSESRIDVTKASGFMVPVVTIQDYFIGRKIDLLKIDVEGFEQTVLEGAMNLLKDPKRRPRAIYIEMHPFAWAVSGASSQQILTLLHQGGYELFALDGQPVNEIKSYGEAIARPLA
jgi:FkbM family methyltransferase